MRVWFVSRKNWFECCRACTVAPMYQIPPTARAICVGRMRASVPLTPCEIICLQPSFGGYVFPFRDPWQMKGRAPAGPWNQQPAVGPPLGYERLQRAIKGPITHFKQVFSSVSLTAGSSGISHVGYFVSYQDGTRKISKASYYFALATTLRTHVLRKEYRTYPGSSSSSTIRSNMPGSLATFYIPSAHPSFHLRACSHDHGHGFGPLLDAASFLQ